MANAARDQNRIPTLLGVSSTDGDTPIRLTANAANGALKIDKIPNYETVTDPAVDSAVTTAIIDARDGVLITTTTTGNSQTLANPTDTTVGLPFVVINNDTSTNTINVNGNTLQIGDAIIFYWDGTSWIEEDKKNFYYNMMSTGLLTGGEISINSGDNTKADITAGTGLVVDNYTDPLNPVVKRVSWNAFTAITIDNIATQPFTYISIDGTGSVVQQAALQTAAEARDLIILGIFTHTGGTILEDVSRFTNGSAIDATAQFYEIGLAFGQINISGNVYSANGTNLKLDKTAGFAYNTGANWFVSKKDPNNITTPAQTALSFVRVFKDGLGDFTFSGLVSDVDPDRYDDGTGGTGDRADGVVNTDQWTVKRFFTDAGSGILFFHYGQGVYNSEAAARYAVLNENFTIAPALRNIIFRGWLLVKGGATNLSDSNDAIFIDASRFNAPLGTDSSLTPTVKSYTFTSRGISAGTYYLGGYYNASSSDANLTQASTTVNFGTANIAYGARAFVVSGGNGSTDGSDLVLTVSGTSFTDAGVRTTADSEVIVATATSSAVNTYYQTTKKWIGTITYTLSSTGGTTFSYDFNYGFVKFEDIGNRQFTVTDFEVIGSCGQNDTSFNIELLHHKFIGWTYASTGFVAGNGVIVDMNTDYVTENDLLQGENFSYKRSGLTTPIDVVNGEGVIIRVTTGSNNSVQVLDAHIKVEI